MHIELGIPREKYRKERENKCVKKYFSCFLVRCVIIPSLIIIMFSH